jgi:hypothetical protein
VDVLEVGVPLRIGNEHRFARFQCLPDLGIAVEVHHVVADRGVLVRRYEAGRALAVLGQIDRTAVEPERLTQLACNTLQDVDDVQGAGDFLEDLDHRQQVLALVLELADPALKLFGRSGLGACVCVCHRGSEVWAHTIFVASTKNSQGSRIHSTHW